MSDTYTWPQRCPDLTQDVSLKRARVDYADGSSALKIVGDVPPPDVNPLIEAVGSTSDTTDDSTVIGLLKQEVAKPAADLTPVTTSLGAKSDTAWDGQTTDASVISVLKGIYNKL